MAEPYDFLVKVVMLGDSGVGKTSIMTRFCKSLFPEEVRATIYTDFIPKDVVIEGKVLRAQVWDTAGQERYRVVTSAYYRDAAAVLLVYDITDRKSFRDIETWLEELKGFIDLAKVEIVLLGNKTDREDQREVSTMQGQSLATAHGLTFLETSAKTASNIDSAFELLLSQLYHRHIHPSSAKEALPPGVKPRHTSIFLHSEKRAKGSACCSRG